MKEWIYRTTNYREAWLRFRKTEDYKRLDACLKEHGIKQPYRNNIMQLSFAAGWGNKKIKILE